jgi:hypothetical protein
MAHPMPINVYFRVNINNFTLKIIIFGQKHNVSKHLYTFVQHNNVM